LREGKGHKGIGTGLELSRIWGEKNQQGKDDLASFTRRCRPDSRQEGGGEKGGSGDNDAGIDGGVEKIGGPVIRIT